MDRFPIDKLQEHDPKEMCEHLRSGTNNLTEYCVVVGQLHSKRGFAFQMEGSFQESCCRFFFIDPQERPEEFAMLNLRDAETIAVLGMYPDSLVDALKFLKLWKKDKEDANGTRNGDKKGYNGMLLSCVPAKLVSKQNEAELQAILQENTDDLVEYCVVFSRLSITIGKRLQAISPTIAGGAVAFMDSLCTFFGAEQSRFEQLGREDVDTISIEGLQHSLLDHLNFIKLWKSSFGSNMAKNKNYVALDVGRFSVDSLRQENPDKIQKLLKEQADSLLEYCLSFSLLQVKVGNCIQVSGDFEEWFCLYFDIEPEQFDTLTIDDVETISADGFQHSLTEYVSFVHKWMALEKGDKKIAATLQDSAAAFETKPPLQSRALFNGSKVTSRRKTTGASSLEVNYSRAGRRETDDAKGYRKKRSAPKHPRVSPITSKERVIPSALTNQGPEFDSPFLWPQSKRRRKEKQRNYDPFGDTVQSLIGHDCDSTDDDSKPASHLETKSRHSIDELVAALESSETGLSLEEEGRDEEKSQTDESIHVDNPWDPPKEKKRRPKVSRRFDPDLHGTAWSKVYKPTTVKSTGKTKTKAKTNSNQRCKPKHALLVSNVTNRENRGVTPGVYPKNSEWKVMQRDIIYIAKVVSGKIVAGKKINVKWVGYRRTERIPTSRLEVPTDSDFDTFEEMYARAKDLS